MLFRRGKVYHFRQWVPLDLRGVLGCKELVRSLKTPDKVQAKILAGQLEYEANRLIYMVRSGMLDVSQIDGILEEFKTRELHELTNRRRVGGAFVYLPISERNRVEADKSNLIDVVVDYHTQLKKRISADIQMNNYAVIKDDALQFLAERGITENTDSKSFQIFCEYMLKAKREISHEIIGRMVGRSVTDGSLNPRVGAELQPKLSDLWKAYREEKKVRGKWGGSTEAGYERFYSEIVNILGDKELSTYSRKDAVKLLGALSHNSASTATGKIEFLSSLFKFTLKTPESTEQWKVRGNPFTEMQIASTADDDSGKISYSQDDLVKLVSGLLNVRKLVEPHRFWVPLIALYTGARQNDICQLRMEDITVKEGILIFRFCHKPSIKQTTKTRKTRECPVHPTLKRIGFERYLDSCRKTGQDLLFSTISYSKGKKWTGRIRTWWNETYQQSHITHTENKSFHSMRHNFFNRFKQSECYDTYNDRSIVQSMAGHDESDVTAVHYEEDYSPAIKLRMLTKLDYGFDKELIEKLRSKEY